MHTDISYFANACSSVIDLFFAESWIEITILIKITLLSECRTDPIF